LLKLVFRRPLRFSIQRDVSDRDDANALHRLLQERLLLQLAELRCLELE
jgi:hypothetical protein